MKLVAALRSLLKNHATCSVSLFSEHCSRWSGWQQVVEPLRGQLQTIVKPLHDENAFWQIGVRYPWLLRLLPDTEQTVVYDWLMLYELIPESVRRLDGAVTSDRVVQLAELFVWFVHLDCYTSARLVVYDPVTERKRASRQRAGTGASASAVQGGTASDGSSAKYRDEDRSLDLYLREIGNVPLISRDDEARLAGRIKQGDQQALEQLIKANLRFVVSVAKQYQNQGLPLVDLINEGNIGLIKAAKRFDGTRGFKFISYAVWWIRQTILQALAEQSRIVRLPLNRVGTLHKINKVATRLEQGLGREPSPEEIAKELELDEGEVTQTMGIASDHMSLDAEFTSGESNSLMDVLPDVTVPTPYANDVRESMRAEIAAALDTLTPREADMVALYFGLNHEQALTLEEIGARYALTRERVRQIMEKAIRRLRHASRSRSLRTYWRR